MVNSMSVRLERVSKSFFRKKVFENVSYTFTPGCYAIVGANGTGKSTLLSMIAGVVSSDSGLIFVNNINIAKQPVATKKMLSYVPDGVLIYPFMSGGELIQLICAAKNVSVSTATKALISQLKLSDYIDTRFSAMSLGTQRKFMLAAATIGNPDIYIFDEPSNAIEQSSREVFIDYLLGLSNNKIILFSTHDNELIERVKAKKILLKQCSLVL